MPVCLLAVPSWVGSDTGQPTPPRGAQGCPLDAEPCLSWPVPQGLLGEQLPAAAPWGHPAPPRLSGESPPAPCLLVPLPPCSPVRREAVQKVNLSLQVKSRVPSPWLWLCAARSSPRPHRQRAERLGVWPRCWALFPAAPARLALPVLLAWNGFSVVWREAPLYRVDLGGCSSFRVCHPGLWVVTTHMGSSLVLFCLRLQSPPYNGRSHMREPPVMCHCHLCCIIGESDRKILHHQSL